MIYFFYIFSKSFILRDLKKRKLQDASYRTLVEKNESSERKEKTLMNI